jgi:cyclic pyranopterin phosphate synthase
MSNTTSGKSPVESPAALIDGCGRRIDYLRLSVTDRCDFRCVYCMAEDMEFLPRSAVLSLEEILRLATVFTGLGIQRIRLTGGEPLVRHGIVELVEGLATNPALQELMMTSNGSRLDQFAVPLVSAGLDRINISLDTLDAARFRSLTRTGSLRKVLTGIDTAMTAGFDRIKLNAVIMRGRNDDEIIPLLEFARERSLDITFIEEMPLGAGLQDRREQFCSAADVRSAIREHHELQRSADSSAGPSRYYRMPDSDIRVGFVSPHSQNFCAECNRIRMTADGRLLLCLGNERALDLMTPLRDGASDAELACLITDALTRKPEQLHFYAADGVQVLRFMNMTGG